MTISEKRSLTEESAQGETWEERPVWGEFSGGETDVVGEYREPTAEQKEKFQKRLGRLSEIFTEADFQWYLDGATNISLYLGKQMRDHKDLDISVFREDLPKLRKLLARQGFDIFVNFIKGGRHLMSLATAEELAAADRTDLSICQVGVDGKIKKDADEPFNFVDLHVHHKDGNGDTVIFYNGATLPKEFFVPIKKELPNGKIINLSQPAIVAYHKLHTNRPYDLTDLRKLRPFLGEEDFKMLREGLENEITGKVRNKLQEAWDLLSPEFKMTSNPRAIADKFFTHPDLKGRKDDPKVFAYVSAIAKYISENPRASFEDFFNESVSILKLREQIEKKLKILDELEKIKD
ncbi:MAG: hypothetical protein WC702_00900 [Patescibacteria group bacterium]|jgi:hypothetical protein